ncbi:hypothetical protein A3A46_01755 [Candidatus Roizmanbacteria bacterium RIFCSPLOWO2_01_FULL_37_13]|uniref:ATP synthase gamma chain n=1 Tax=Candidatus Roizmanbacteria bacterium RIFCSPHIGHO2_02_FULL_38_11 TaxID=1802039 RepID=A0A1F7H1W5_9BACT|nr:MAG: hypothetical protein A3C25_01415 [Candidatus Roizmanbacteria bacterium RIFCSPHIGHO2_02_FULL_38_11]OGK41983.1 MAG: hypothetical protein A3A46_01755 [Candidatus Roizmanbacteria bacterium RIFCSPLOWO2_01_FULL_37_13]
MQYKKLIQSEIDFTKTFRYITQAYEEIAVMRIRKVRASVLQAREYFTKLSDVYFEVKKAFERQKKEKEILKRTEQIPVNTRRVGKSMSTLASQTHPQGAQSSSALASQTHPQGAQSSSTLPEGEYKYKLNKSVSVFLSANTTLYGDIIARIFKLFLENIDKKETDVIIIGRLGRRLYEELETKKPYLYFELPDFEINLENLKPVIYYLVKYKTIMVYYGKFESIVTQQAAASNISGDQRFGADKKPGTSSDPGLGTKFLFEPSLESIMAFFEDLITLYLFRQTVFETQLARWASRIMAMEKAQVNIETQIKRLRFLDTKINRADQQKKQLERLSGISLWRR